MTDQLVSDLAAIVGAAHVETDAAACDRWRIDPTGKYRGCPRAVVRPGSTAEVAAVMRLADRTRTPVVPVSGNTGLSGGAFAGRDGRAVMLSLDRMNRIREIRPQARVAVVEAGVVLDSLHKAAEDHGLIFPLFFGARGSAMIGGNLSTNAGGSNVLRYGNTRELCLGLEVVTPQGEIVDLMNALYKDNTGYSLKNLYIGAEGTLGVITGAVLRLYPRPLAYATAMVGVADLDAALTLLQRLQDATSGAVEAYEYMPAAYFEAYALRFPGERPPFETPQPHAVLVELGATGARDAAPHPDSGTVIGAELEAQLAAMLEEGMVTDAVIARSQAQRAQMWERRERAFEVSLARGIPVGCDISVPLEQVGTFLQRMETRLPDAFPQAQALSIAHLGDGNLHYSVWMHPDTGAAPTAEEWDGVMEMVEDVVQELRGSFSAEHGIGLSKLGSMSRRKDPAALEVMRRIKRALDPQGIMNPGKVVP